MHFEVKMDEKTREIILNFANEHLQPYKIHTKPLGGEEIVPSLCPFCHGGDRGDQNTFALNLDKGLFVCKRGSCGKRGSFETLAEHFHEKISLGLSFSSASKAESTVFLLPDTELLPPTEQVYKYFEDRKISRATVDAYHVQSDSRGVIVFPFYENSVNVYEKFRRPWLPKNDYEKRSKECSFAGAKPVLFGMDDCSFSKPLVITEGQIDAMSLHEAGITNAVSVPSGCENMDWIPHC